MGLENDTPWSVDRANSIGSWGNPSGVGGAIWTHAVYTLPSNRPPERSTARLILSSFESRLPRATSVVRTYWAPSSRYVATYVEDPLRSPPASASPPPWWPAPDATCHPS